MGLDLGYRGFKDVIKMRPLRRVLIRRNLLSFFYYNEIQAQTCTEGG